MKSNNKERTMKKVWNKVREAAWWLWDMLGWLLAIPEMIAEEREIEAECEEERLRSAWKLDRERKERAFEAEGRAA